MTFAFDQDMKRLLVMAPHLVDHREPGGEELGYLDALDRALAGFRELRAGRAGLLTLTPIVADPETDSLFVASRTWQSLTSYVVTRHQ